MLKFYQRRKWVYIKDRVNYHCHEPIYICKEGYKIRGVYRSGKEKYHYSQKHWVVYKGRNRIGDYVYLTLECAKLFCQLHHRSLNE